MKKSIFLLPLILLTMSGCNSNANENNFSNKPKSSVTLTAENFSSYVATQSTSTLIDNAYNDVIYYTYFIGADYCKFIDCTVTYTYIHDSSTNAVGGQTIKLTLSGDGEAWPYHAIKQSNHIYYWIVVTSASGTVEIYR